jgi:cysteinyl-tRNA synthetase
MPIVLHDTARAARVELRAQQPGRMGIYSCGPTVHARKHVADLRQYVVVDVLTRHLRASRVEVRHVINITDVGHLTDDGDAGEDRVERAARKSGKTVEATAQGNTSLFQRDLLLLGVEPPTVWAKASAHVEQQVALIRELEARGFTYLTPDGLYFDTSKDREYGRFLRALDGGSSSRLRALGRDEKRRQSDFALWKFAGAASRREPWQSPWGLGFPGWHSECAAMALANLEGGIDLHTGTVDHLHAHHENELAQCENLGRARPTVGHWLHVESLLAGLDVNRARAPASALSPRAELRRMDPRFDNVVTLDDVLERGFSPRVLRFFLLGTHYRQRLEFSFDALSGAASSYQRLVDRVAALGVQARPPGRGFSGRIRRRFEEALDDDLNTPRALAALWVALSHAELSTAEKLGAVSYMDAVLGLDLLEAASLASVRDRTSLSPPIMRLLERRNLARFERDFERSDALRVELERLGFLVEDYSDGTRIRPRPAGTPRLGREAAS